MKGKRRSRQAILAAVTVLAAAHQDYEAVLVDESGTIWLTPGLKDRFIPVDQGGDAGDSDIVILEQI